VSHHLYFMSANAIVHEIFGEKRALSWSVFADKLSQATDFPSVLRLNDELKKFLVVDGLVSAFTFRNFWAVFLPRFNSQGCHSMEQICELLSAPYWRGSSDSKQLREELLEHPIGTFLLRLSQNVLGDFAFAVRTQADRVDHYRLERKIHQSSLQAHYVLFGRSFPTLLDFVDFLLSNDEPFDPDYPLLSVRQPSVSTKEWAGDHSLVQGAAASTSSQSEEPDRHPKSSPPPRRQTEESTFTPTASPTTSMASLPLPPPKVVVPKPSPKVVHKPLYTKKVVFRGDHSPVSGRRGRSPTPRAGNIYALLSKKHQQQLLGGQTVSYAPSLEVMSPFSLYCF